MTATSADAAADQTHKMMQDLADHWGLAVVMGASASSSACSRCSTRARRS